MLDFSGGSVIKNLPTNVGSLGQEDPLEEEMAAHSSILAWEIPWTEDPGGLPTMGSQSQTRLSDQINHNPVTPPNSSTSIS